MATVQLLQLSDLHLGATFGWLPREQRIERRREQVRALRRAIEAAIERGVHAILIPGDLFDDVEADAETMASTIDAFRIAGCPPAFIAPGNHDPWSEASALWSPRMLKARGWQWPAHVHVFDQPHWTSRSLESAPVRIWGRCWTPGMASTERPLDAAARNALGALPANELHVGVFHGSLEGHLPPGQKMCAPFSVEEVQHAPFAYLAVGHYHKGLASARCAYAGSAVALSCSESGAHGALEVAIDFGSGPASARYTPIELDPRRAHVIPVDISAAGSAEDVDRRVAESLAAAGVAERDLVRVRLTGRLARGVRYSAPGPEVAERAWHVRIDGSGARPDYDFDQLRQASDETTEGRFARVLLERLDGERDPETRATLERALYYGLDAFRLREVAPYYEELRS